MRFSAEIGSEKITRSTRVRRPNSTRSSTVPSFGSPAHSALLRSSPRSSNTPMISTPESFCLRRSSITRAPGSPPPTMTVRRVRRPSRVQRRTSRNRILREAISATRPTTKKRRARRAKTSVAGLGEERGADGDQEHHRPGRGEPHVLLLVAAERLHLVDVGDLERQHRQRADDDRRRQIEPEQAFAARQIGAEDRHADQHDQREFDHAHEAGEHDRRDRRGQRLSTRRRAPPARAAALSAWRAGLARSVSSTAAALSAFNEARTSESIIAVAMRKPAAPRRDTAAVSLNPGKF